MDGELTSQLNYEGSTAMSAYHTQVKEYINRFAKEKGIPSGLIDPHEVAEWAYSNGLHKPNVRTIIDAIAADITQVFREEYRLSASGLRYRAMHSVKKKVGNKTLWLWADMDNPDAQREHFERSFADRRRQIVGDCVQLKTDVDVYNEKHSTEPAIQLILDFTDDVAELQQLDQDEPKAA
jgi:hypothetical protein